MNRQTVFIVEDDKAMRESITWMLRTEGLKVESFASAQSALDWIQPDMQGCLVVDLKLPDMNGLELQQALADKGCQKPFVMISAHGDVSSAVDAMHQGAIDFLEKPFNGGELIACVQQALQHDQTLEAQKRQRAEYESKLASLTAREHEILQHVVGGRRTKEIARELGISSSTVEVHRSRIMQKMGVETVVQLVKLCVESDDSDN